MDEDASRDGDRLAVLFTIWAEAVWNRHASAAAPALHEDVIFVNEPTGEQTRGRERVLDLLLSFDRPPRLTRVEAFERGDRAYLFSEGRDLHAGGHHGPPGRSYLMFAFEGSVIREIRSFASPSDALDG